MAMPCRECNSPNTRVTCTTDFENYTKRYCRCLDCRARFRTIERYEVYKRGPKPGGVLLDTQGSKNGFSVLTEENVVEMRKMKEKGMTNRELAKVFGVNSGHVSRIVNRKIWKHV